MPVGSGAGACGRLRRTWSVAGARGKRACWMRVGSVPVGYYYKGVLVGSVLHKYAMQTNVTIAVEDALGWLEGQGPRGEAPGRLAVMVTLHRDRGG